eukprot:Lankesteria_metandrocarpae@DN5222_c0_g1_i3.p1
MVRSVFVGCLLSLFAHSANAIFFRLNPHTQECLLYDVKKDDHLVGSYEISPSDSLVEMTIVLEEPDTATGRRYTVVRTEKNAVGGHLDFDPEHTTDVGSYRICFRSRSSHPVTTSFHFKSAEHLHGQLASEDHAKNISLLVNKIVEKVQELGFQQEYRTTSEAVHRDCGLPLRILQYTFI